MNFCKVIKRLKKFEGRSKWEVKFEEKNFYFPQKEQQKSI